MRSMWRPALIACVLIGACPVPAPAELRLPALISDHMVVQQRRPIRIWGWADPGAKVTVRLADRSARATADDQGRWRAALPRLKAGGPHELTVETDTGEKKTIHDVLVGEVWVCGGQSNMEWSVEM